MQNIDAQIREKLSKLKGFHPVKRLCLNGSDKVIIPYPYDQKKMWLEDCPEVFSTFNIDGGALRTIMQDLGLMIDYGRSTGDHTILIEERKIDEDRCDCFPVAVYGRLEPGGSLSVIAFFEDEQEGQIIRTEYAAVTNFSVEWVHCPFQPTSVPTCTCSCNPTHDGNQ